MASKVSEFTTAKDQTDELRHRTLITTDDLTFKNGSGSNSDAYQNVDAPQPNETIATDSSRYPTGWRLAAIMASLCLGTLVVAIDNTIIGVAVPKISTVFDALDDVGWYGSAYLLTVTALQPTFGNIYKYFDIKTTYIVSICVFE
ncbi:MAG: hypothetical protein Q9226_001336, partial [Calogaya cf. arnoldii]